MTVVAVRTAASLYRVSGVGYAPEGAFTLAADGPEGPASPGGDAGAGAPLSDAKLSAVRVLLEGVVLCNDSALTKTPADAAAGGGVTYSPLGAPTEVALLTAAEKAGVEVKALKAAKPRVASVPFESEHKVGAPLGSPHRSVAPSSLCPSPTPLYPSDSSTRAHAHDTQTVLGGPLCVVGLRAWAGQGGVRAGEQAGGSGVLKAAKPRVASMPFESEHKVGAPPPLEAKCLVHVATY